MKYIKTCGPLYLKAFDGHVIDTKELLEWLHFSLDTHYIKAWYKNGDGYYVKVYDSDDFVRVIYA